MGKQSDFNGISPYYDGLVTLVFGRSMRLAQTIFLNTISPASNILVIGGGTGWWVRDFMASHPDCKIVYLEASEKMIAMTRLKVGENDRIEFRVGTESSIREVSHFDAVITFCYLDLFSGKELNEVIGTVSHSLKPIVKWFVVDFVATKYWHRWMLVVMYKFFGVITGLENQELPDWTNALKRNEFEEKKVKFFYGDFIKSAVFEGRS